MLKIMVKQTEQSRVVALKFCELFNKRRFDLHPPLFTADAKWLVVANTERAPWGSPTPLPRCAIRLGNACPFRGMVVHWCWRHG